MPESQKLLEERVKELRCLYGIARAFERRDAGLDELVRETVGLIPEAWQYPEVAWARIALAGAEASSERYAPGPWLQECPVIVYGRPQGTVSVGYAEARPPADEGPFLAEERNLLNAIAQLLGEVTERKQAEARVTEHQAKLRRLAAELALSEQRERRRIAEALHDRIGQSLALVKLHLGAALERAAGTDVAPALRQVRELVSQVITETRTLTFDLCPPILYELGLAAALAWLAEQARERHGLEVRFDEGGSARDVPVPAEIEATLFTAAQELVANVARHARAHDVTLRLVLQPGRATVVVSDDGDGFDVALVRARATQPGGFGLFSIHERVQHLGGALEIVSAVGRGTTVRIEVPLGAAAAGSEERATP